MVVLSGQGVVRLAFVLMLGTAAHAAAGAQERAVEDLRRWHRYLYASPAPLAWEG